MFNVIKLYQMQCYDWGCSALFATKLSVLSSLQTWLGFELWCAAYEIRPTLHDATAVGPALL